MRISELVFLGAFLLGATFLCAKVIDIAYGRELYRLQVACMDDREVTHAVCNYWHGARP